MNLKLHLIQFIVLFVIASNIFAAEASKQSIHDLSIGFLTGNTGDSKERTLFVNEPADSAFRKSTLSENTADTAVQFIRAFQALMDKVIPL